jgi:hypothetical protein
MVSALAVFSLGFYFKYIRDREILLGDNQDNGDTSH